MAKTGRPPIKNPRNYGINLRLKEQELADIQYCADKLGTTRANAIVTATQMLKASLNEAAEPTGEDLANNIIETIKEYGKNEDMSKLERLYAFIFTKLKD